jgi:glycosyltransferase involved in cell wall biosynthesis
MRILVVIYEFPPIGGGGGYIARDICRELARREHEIHILTARYKDLPRWEKKDGMEIFRVPSYRRSPHSADLKTMASFVFGGLWGGWRHLQNWQPDIFHVHFAVPSGPVAWALSRLSDIPYILTTHLGDVPHGVPDKTEKWFRWIFPFTPPIWRDAAHIVAVSEHTRQLALKSYPVNISVIPNGLSLQGFSPNKIRINSPPTIIFAGRFVSQKNPLQFVRTLAELQDFPWNCFMVGDGPLRPQVELEIRNSGMENRFISPGWLSPEEVLEWLRKSDILFMPSLSEGMPIVGVKALVTGLAIVASKVSGFVELVDEGENGYLVDVQDTNGFKNSLRELLSNPQKLKDYKEASLRIAQNFDIQRIADSYERLFLDFRRMPRGLTGQSKEHTPTASP